MIPAGFSHLSLTYSFFRACMLAQGEETPKYFRCVLSIPWLKEIFTTNTHPPNFMSPTRQPNLGFSFAPLAPCN